MASWLSSRRQSSQNIVGERVRCISDYLLNVTTAFESFCTWTLEFLNPDAQISYTSASCKLTNDSLCPVLNVPDASHMITALKIVPIDHFHFIPLLPAVFRTQSTQKNVQESLEETNKQCHSLFHWDSSRNDLHHAEDTSSTLLLTSRWYH